jgi:hypothetical protein
MSDGERAMMGRLERGQEQLFYAFNLEAAVPQDHQVRSIAAVLDLSWVHGALAPHYVRCAIRCRSRLGSHELRTFRLST